MYWIDYLNHLQKETTGSEKNWKIFLSKYTLVFMLKAADLQKSFFDPLMEADEEGVDVPLVAFNKIVLDGSKPRGLRIFRIAEDPMVLVIDQHIKTALKENRPANGWGVIYEEIDMV